MTLTCLAVTQSARVTFAFELVSGLSLCCLCERTDGGPPLLLLPLPLYYSATSFHVALETRETSQHLMHCGHWPMTR